jgi:hypothetical protein
MRRDRTDAFIEEIRTLPTFAARDATDRVWSEHLAAIEFALHEIDRRADNDPASIEIFDKLVAVITDTGEIIYEEPAPIGQKAQPATDRQPRKTAETMKGFLTTPE